MMRMQTFKKISGLFLCMWLIFTNFSVAYANDASEKQLQTQSASGSYACFLTRTSSYGGTKVKLSVSAVMWSDGPYAQINSVLGQYLNLESQVTDTVIEDSHIKVWGPGGVFPTTQLYYTYSGTLVARVTAATSASVKADLQAADFSVGETMNGTTYYSLPMSKTGTISLY